LGVFTAAYYNPIFSEITMLDELRSDAAATSGFKKRASSARPYLLKLFFTTLSIIAVACTSEESVTDPSVGLESAVVKRYTTVDLGTLGGRISHATAINSAGQVVGYSELASGSDQHAFLWDRGVMTDLGTLGGGSSRATVINPAGEVFGLSGTAAGGPAHAFRWKNGQMTDLGTLGAANESEPRGINPRGQLVGRTLIPHPSGFLLEHAFVWENGSLRDLGAGVANAINPQGQIAGRRSLLATVWDKSGVPHDLQTLGVDGADAADINPRGQVVGTSTLTPGPEEPVFVFFHAVLWENGVARDLGVLGCSVNVSRCNSAANGINPSGLVVGWSETREGFEHAFVWQNGVMTDLDPTGFFSHANAVNPTGQVVGESSRTGDLHATLWTRN
jgi:probable HAF family extracellular repeat protein